MRVGVVSAVRCIGLGLAALSLFLVSELAYGADQVVGTLPSISGIPPLVTTGTFYSPTRWIRLTQPSCSAGVHVSGWDSQVQGCNGVQFHVVGECRINGLVIPPNQHMYWPASNGDCQEIYSWEGVEVDLGAPGWFTIRRVADNTLGVGRVWAYCWTIRTVGEIPPPFEILSASFDRSFYREGTEAELTITTKSNWGSGTNLSLVPIMVPAQGDEIQLYPQSLSFTPGQQQVNVFHWTVPQFDYCTWWDARVELRNGGDLLATQAFNNEIATNDVDPAETEQVQAQIVECAAGAACLTQIWASVPYLGYLVEQQNSANLSCLAEAAMREDPPNELKAEVFRTIQTTNDVLTVVELASIGAAIVTHGAAIPVVALANTVVGFTLDAAVCAVEWLDWMDGLRSRAPLGAFVGELADSVRANIDTTGVAFADLVLVEGPNEVRVLADSCYSTADSVGLAGAMTSFIGPTRGGSWTLLRQHARCFATYHENPHSVSRVEVRPDSTDSLAVVLLHRGPDGNLMRLSYPPLAVQPSTVLSLTMADTLVAIPLQVDFDGDGTVDWSIEAGEVSAAPEFPTAITGPTIISARAIPNPSYGSVAFRLQIGRAIPGLEIRVVDVSGRSVRTITAGALPVGAHSLPWDGRDDHGSSVPSGVYFYRVAGHGGPVLSNRMLVLK